MDGTEVEDYCLFTNKKNRRARIAILFSVDCWNWKSFRWCWTCDINAMNGINQHSTLRYFRSTYWKSGTGSNQIFIFSHLEMKFQIIYLILCLVFLGRSEVDSIVFISFFVSPAVVAVPDSFQLKRNPFSHSTSICSLLNFTERFFFFSFSTVVQQLIFCALIPLHFHSSNIGWTN